jgi:hypothetical protein
VWIGDLRIEPTKEPLDRIIAKEAKSWGNRLNGGHFEQAREPAVSDMRREIRLMLVKRRRSDSREINQPEKPPNPSFADRARLNRANSSPPCRQRRNRLDRRRTFQIPG